MAAELRIIQHKLEKNISNKDKEVTSKRIERYLDQQMKMTNETLNASSRKQTLTAEKEKDPYTKFASAIKKEKLKLC